MWGTRQLLPQRNDIIILELSGQDKPPFFILYISHLFAGQFRPLVVEFFCKIRYCFLPLILSPTYENELYYVGKSTDLKNRVKQHLKDRHLASWTHFSLYLVRNEDHIGEIESLIIRVANPKGNRKKYRTDKGTSLLKQLQASVKQRQQDEYNTMFSKTDEKRVRPVAADKNSFALDGLVRKKTALFRTYKGKEYRALLTPKGKIKFNGKIYATPTAAAMKIVNRSAVNGWVFWYFKNADGEWARLSELRGK